MVFIVDRVVFSACEINPFFFFQFLGRVGMMTSDKLSGLLITGPTAVLFCFKIEEDKQGRGPPVLLKMRDSRDMKACPGLLHH
jgi:hypothetical protein